MRHLILALSLCAFAFPTFASTDWTQTAASVRQSIVEISMGEEGKGGCTGFVSDNDRDLVMTAAHCDGPKMMADSMPATIKAKDVKSDLMVLHVPGIDRPALRLAKTDPKVGDEVASYGYGYALDQPLFRVAHVSARNANIGERVQYLAIDSTFVSGQSGGPVVNAQGEVVMIVQLGNEFVGFGVGAERVEDRVGRFFQKSVAK